MLNKKIKTDYMNKEKNCLKFFVFYRIFKNQRENNFIKYFIDIFMYNYNLK